MKRLLPSLLYCLLVLGLSLCTLKAQRAPATTTANSSFVQQLRQFDQWRRSTDITKQRGWKFYKRWEQEQLMHTDANGALVEPELYMRELLRAGRDHDRSRAMLGDSLWFSIGPQQRPRTIGQSMQVGMGRCNCIAFHPNDSLTFYAGVAQGGIWKTSDGGKHWEAKCNGLPILRVSDIAIDKRDPNLMYVALGDFEYISFGLLKYGRKRNTYYGMGVYKSTDGGEHWSATGLGYSLDGGEATLIRSILISPLNSNVIVAAGANGVHISYDAGAHWSTSLDQLMWDLVADPDTPTTLYATSGYLAASRSGHAAIWKSLDFGKTWKELSSTIPPTGACERIKLAIAPSDTRVIYAVATDVSSGLYAVYRSINSGSTWKKRFDSLNILEWQFGKSGGGQGTYDLVALVNEKNSGELYVGGVNIWASTDSAASFNPVTYWTAQYGLSVHADQHQLKFQSQSGAYYLCNDGGVYRSRSMKAVPWSDILKDSSWKTSWEELSSGIPMTSFYRVSSSGRADGRVMAGAQDNASSYFDGKEWLSVIGGDGMDNWIANDDDRMFIGSSQYGFFAKTSDGINFKGLSICKEDGEWTTPLVPDPIKPNVLYAVYGNVYRSADHGDTWTKISNFAFDSTNKLIPEGSAFAVCRADTNVMVVCKRPHFEYSKLAECHRTSDGGKTWTSITKGLPDSLYFTSVELSDDDPNTIWITCAGLSAGNKVFRSDDGGAHWSNISYDLPNFSMNVIRLIPNSYRHVLLLGTDIGVYCFDDSAKSWQSYSSNLPKVIVTDLEINQTASTVYASTFGRGIWATPLINRKPVVASVEQSDATDLIQVTPSPAHAQQSFSIRYSSTATGPMTLIISDIRGRRIADMALVKNEQSIDIRINQALQPGVYVARCICGRAEKAKIFVVE